MVNPDFLANPPASAQKRRPAVALTQQPFVTIALVAIILANVLGSLYWINRNVVLVGNDASNYLGVTLEYARFLTHISPTTLFQAFTYPEYRTPGLFVAVQPFYWLFGANMDSAQLFVVLMLAALVWICYALGRDAGGSGVGLMSALLIGLLPMVMAMARLFYTELPLAALVALNLLALTRSDGFRRRGWTIVWGVSLGAGLLMKWALPLYILLPTLWIIWKSELLQAHWASLRQSWPSHWPLHWRALVIAAAASLVVTLIWCVPNRAAIQNYPLGDLLFLAWFVTGLLWLYTLQLPGTRVSNWWAGVFTAVVIASVWYFPHIDFLSKLLGAEETRGDAGATPLNIVNYLRYFFFFQDYHLGALATWIIVPTALFPWLRALWLRKPLRAQSVIFWLTLLSTYLVLLLLSQSSPRFLVPALPAVAVLGAISLWQYRPRLRLTLGIVWVAILALQWSLFTFDGLQPVYAQSERLWTLRDYSVQPRSYDTDLGFWIEPDILDQMTAVGSPEVQRLGMLANSHQLHRGMIKYLIELEQRPVEVQTLTESNSPGWLGVLSSQWVLVNEGDNKDVDAPAQALIQRILGGDPVFDALYQEVKRYALPNGDTAHLYHRTVGPGRPLDLPLQAEQTKGIADAVTHANSPHASLLYANPNVAVWVGMHDPAGNSVQVLPGDDQLDIAALDQLTDTVVVVWDHEAEKLTAWMNEHAYRTTEVGDDFASVAIYGRTAAPLSPVSVTDAWPNLALGEVHTLPTISRGQVLPLETRLATEPTTPLSFSVRLLDSSGAVIANHDRQAAATDRFGLFVPPSTPPGDYELVAILYDPATSAVINSRSGATAVKVATIHVED